MKDKLIQWLETQIRLGEKCVKEDFSQEDVDRYQTEIDTYKDVLDYVKKLED